jgi:outer membrane immunogenic protein
MKKLLLAALLLGAGAFSAMAADLAPRPYAKAPMMATSAYSWTGFYIGGHAGYDWMDSTDRLTPANALTAGSGFFIPPTIIANFLPLDPKGFIGGGQAGYNWQVSPMWVVGLETDLSWTNLDQTTALPGPADFTRIMTAHEKLDWFGTFRGRAGITPVDRLLIYGTGGVAYGHASLSTALTRIDPVTGANTCILPGGGGNNCQKGSASDTKIGWTVGAGLEWAVAGPWTVKGEYLYYDLGSLSHTMFDPLFPTTLFNATAPLRGNIVRAGLNYRFGGPVVAKY